MAYKPLMPHQTADVSAAVVQATILELKQGLSFDSTINVSGTLVVSLDNKQMFMITINEVIKQADKELVHNPTLQSEPKGQSEPQKRRRKSAIVQRCYKPSNESEEDLDADYGYAQHGRTVEGENSNGSSSINSGRLLGNSDHLSGSSGRSSVNSGHSSTCLESAPQHFVKNSKSESQDKYYEVPEGAIIVQPTGDYEENKVEDQQTRDYEAAVRRSSSENSIPTNLPCSSHQPENTQADNAVATPTRIPTFKPQLNGNGKKGSVLVANALHELSHLQNNNASREPEYVELQQPMNLTSQSASRNDDQALMTVKKEPEETPATLPPSPPANSFYSTGLHPTPAYPSWMNGTVPYSTPNPYAVYQNHLDNGVLPHQMTEPARRLAMLPVSEQQMVLNRHNLHFTSAPSTIETSQTKAPRQRKRKPAQSVAAQEAAAMDGLMGQQTPSSAARKGVQVCTNCGTGQTSAWRRINDALVCNACGLYYGLHQGSNQNSRGNKRGLCTSGMGPGGKKQANGNNNGQRCFNCHTDITTMWRRNKEGDPVCNACGLYANLHKKARPMSMVKEGVIHTRRRKTKRAGANKSNAGSKCNTPDFDKSISHSPDTNGTALMPPQFTNFSPNISAAAAAFSVGYHSFMNGNMYSSPAPPAAPAAAGSAAAAAAATVERSPPQATGGSPPSSDPPSSDPPSSAKTTAGSAAAAAAGSTSAAATVGSASSSEQQVNGLVTDSA